jgi:hypothetical protein
MLSFPADEVAELKLCYPNIAVAEEGGVTYVQVSQLELPADCVPGTVDALLCPTARDGYPSRLFLNHKVMHKGKGQNWNPKGSTVILGREWWAISWKIAPGNDRLLSKVAAHLEALKP